ncbi:MAG TPA: hypothetical protein VFL83_01780 [Anaeromyxobacter sp.]|nr:hypothetical protein [Anaeromyxobacter sp.]
MDAELPYKIFKLLWFVAYMVFIYVAFGLVVERFSTKPDSQLKAFARIVCSPITRPVARYLAPGADQRRLLWISLGIAAVLLVAFRIAEGALRPG